MQRPGAEPGRGNSIAGQIRMQSGLLGLLLGLRGARPCNRRATSPDAVLPHPIAKYQRAHVRLEEEVQGRGVQRTARGDRFITISLAEREVDGLVNRILV